jgi:hypothetical protein
MVIQSLAYEGGLPASRYFNFVAVLHAEWEACKECLGGDCIGGGRNSPEGNVAA